MPSSIVDLFGNRRAQNPPPGRGSFNAYAAGNKYYGSGRSFPNMGPVSGQGMLGYNQRDNEAKAKKAAILRRLKGQASGNPMNANVMTGNMGGAIY